jgi:hypothetical protein
VLCGGGVDGLHGSVEGGATDCSLAVLALWWAKSEHMARWPGGCRQQGQQSIHKVSVA